MQERTHDINSLVAARIDRVEARLAAYEDTDPPAEVEAQAVREVEQLVAFATIRAFGPDWFAARWPGIDADFMEEVVAAWGNDPLVCAACAATGADLGPALDALGGRR